MGAQVAKQEISSENKKIGPEDLEWKFYTKTFVEGSTDMPEDPEFPNDLVEQSKEWEYSGPYHAMNGTNVYYPGKKKAKMWIGQYRSLNAADLICNMNLCCNSEVNTMCNPFYDSSQIDNNYHTKKNNNDMLDNYLNTGNCNEISQSPPMCNLLNFFENKNQYTYSQQNIAGSSNMMQTAPDYIAKYKDFTLQNKEENPLQNTELNARMQDAVRIATGQQYGRENLNVTLNKFDCNNFNITKSSRHIPLNKHNRVFNK